MDYSAVRGFNYQPSWGASGLEIWQQFDGGQYEREVALGKRHFPKMNALRIWLSPEAWLRDRKRFESNLETALASLARHDLVAMPVLFNRWHDGLLDYGGVYLDHIVPGISWVKDDRRMAAFVEAVIGPHAADPRILAWDLCNEPFWGNPDQKRENLFFKAEWDWLKGIHDVARRAGARAPLTLGLTTATPLEAMDSLCDVISFHPYLMDNPEVPDEKGQLERLMDDTVAFAAKAGKPLLATEACWGSFDDAKRVENVRWSLEQLNRRKIGWIACALHTSAVIDCHGPEFGPVNLPCNLAFIQADGTLRPGHEITRDYMG